AVGISTQLPGVPWLCADGAPLSGDRRRGPEQRAAEPPPCAAAARNAGRGRGNLVSRPVFLAARALGTGVLDEDHRLHLTSSIRVHARTPATDPGRAAPRYPPARPRPAA